MDYKGLSVPIAPNPSGGLATQEGSEQLRKIIMLSLAFCPSENPFNTDVGIEYPVFDINDVSLQARVAIRIKEVFEKLKKANRAKLDDIRFVSEGEELAVDLKYVDMQTDRHDSLRKTFGGSGSTTG